jgi:cytoskeletal protein CcmA (bactofilin family)
VSRREAAADAKAAGLQFDDELQTQDTSVRAGTPMARLTTDGSVLGPSTRLTGRLSGEGALRIEGTVKGDVSVSGPAEIAEGATVEGNVQAESLELSGSLVGDAVTRGPIAGHAGATVRGELRGSEVSIDPGSRVSVRVDTQFELDLGAARRR